MPRMVKQHFIQTSPIKHFATFCTTRKVLLFFRRQLFVFVGCHWLYVAHSSCGLAGFCDLVF
jgi:hypothetical protein